MRTAREFHPSEKLYVKKSIKYSGRLYNRGDEFPTRDITNKKLLKLFQNGFIGHSEDFRDNKEAIKEVDLKSEEVQKPVEEEKPKEEVSDSPIEEKPKPQKSYRKPHASKKKSEDSED